MIAEWLQYGALGVLALVLAGLGKFAWEVFQAMKALFSRVEARLYQSLDKLDVSSQRLAESFENHETLDRERFGELRDALAEAHKDILRAQRASLNGRNGHE